MCLADLWDDEALEEKTAIFAPSPWNMPCDHCGEVIHATSLFCLLSGLGKCLIVHYACWWDLVFEAEAQSTWR